MKLRDTITYCAKEINRDIARNGDDRELREHLGNLKNIKNILEGVALIFDNVGLRCEDKP